MSLAKRIERSRSALVETFGRVSFYVDQKGVHVTLDNLWMANRQEPNTCGHGLKTVTAATEGELYCELFSRIAKLVREGDYVVYSLEGTQVLQVTGITTEDTYAFKTVDRSYKKGQADDQIIRFHNWDHRDRNLV